MADFIEITDAFQNVCLINMQHIVSVSEKKDISGTFICTLILVVSGEVFRTKEAYADVKRKVLSAGEISICNTDLFKGMFDNG